MLRHPEFLAGDAKTSFIEVRSSRPATHALLAAQRRLSICLPLPASGPALPLATQKNAKALFNFEGHGSLRSSKLLTYLAEVVVNGPGEAPG